MRRFKIKKTVLRLVASLIVLMGSTLILFVNFGVFEFEGVFKKTYSGLYFYKIPLSMPVFSTLTLLSFFSSLYFFIKLKDQIRRKRRSNHHW